MPLDRYSLFRFKVRAVRPLIHKLIIIVCALYLCGAHWAVLQMTAWTGMLVMRSQQVSMVEAVETTFDGQHPCRLCEAIESGKAVEKKQEPKLPTNKGFQDIKFLAEIAVRVPDRVEAEINWPVWAEGYAARREAPASPPPRA